MKIWVRARRLGIIYLGRELVESQQERKRCRLISALMGFLRAQAVSRFHITDSTVHGVPADLSSGVEAAKKIQESWATSAGSCSMRGDPWF